MKAVAAAFAAGLMALPLRARAALEGQAEPGSANGRLLAPAAAPGQAIADQKPEDLQKKAVEAAKKVPDDPAKLDEYLKSVGEPLDALSKTAASTQGPIGDLKKRLAQLKARLAREKPSPDDKEYDRCLAAKPQTKERLSCLTAGLADTIAGLKLSPQPGTAAAPQRPVVPAPKDAVPKLDAPPAVQGDPYAQGLDLLKQQYAKRAASFTPDAARAELARALRADGQRKFYQGDLTDAELPGAVRAFQNAHHLEANGQLDEKTKLALLAQSQQARAASRAAPQRGDADARVGALQRLLRSVDRRLAVDDKFGDRTYAALKRYLAARGTACSGSDCSVAAAPALLAKLSSIPAAQLPLSMRHRVVDDVPAPKVDPRAKRAPRENPLDDNPIAQVLGGVAKGLNTVVSSLLPQPLPASRVPLSPVGQAVRQLGQAFPALPQHALDTLAERVSARPQAPRYIGVADLQGPPGTKRLGVIDLSLAQSDPRRAVQWYAVKEGGGGRHGAPTRTSPLAARYENVNGSFLTPSGLFRLPTNIEPKYGGALRLYGLGPANANSASRGILMHRAFSHAWSEGCLEVEGNVKAVLQKLRGGLLYVAH